LAPGARTDRAALLIGAFVDDQGRFGAKLGPLQDKIFKYVQREINDMEETEGWKLDQEAESEEDPDESWPA
jgi:hypothetical protein